MWALGLVQPPLCNSVHCALEIIGSNVKSSIVEERLLRFIFVPSIVEEQILRFVFVPLIVEE